MGKINNLFVKIKNAKIIFLLTSLFFGLEYFILGPFSYVQISSSLDSFAEKAFLACRTLLAGGGASYWLPYFSGGIDRLSSLDSFGEIGNLLFVFSPWIASAVMVTGGFFLGGFFTFLLCHEILGFGKRASVAAGILFSLPLVDNSAPYLTGMAILPLILFYLEKIFISQKLSLFKKIFSFLILGIIYSFFSSLAYTLPFFSIAIVLWFLLIRRQKSPFFYLFLLLFFLPAGLLKFQEAWSLLINTALSQRGAAAGYWRVNLKGYLHDLFNEAHVYFLKIPVIPIFALLGLWLAKRNRLFWQMFVLNFILFFAMPLLPQISASKLGVFFGPFRFFDLSRFSLLIPFLSSLMVACVLSGLEGVWARISLFKDGKEFSFKAQNVLIGFCLVLVLLNSLIIKEGHFNVWIKAGSYRANTSSPDIAFLAEREKNSPPFRVATMSLRTIKSLDPSLPGFYGLESSDSRTNVISRQEQVFFKLMSKDGRIVDALYFLENLGGQEAEKLAADFDPAKVVALPLLSLSNTKYIISDNLINSPELELLSTPSAELWQPWEKMSEIQKIKFKLAENFSGKKLLVYENKNYFPRFFLARKIKPFASDEEIQAGLSAADEKTLRDNVFLAEADAEKIPRLSGSAEKIDILQYTNDSIKLKINSDGPSVLVIGNNFSPFWRAKVNGQSKEILPAYYAFMAVPLETASSEVELVYNPPYKIDSAGIK
jgi:hypothetical protein